jgi:hypothetical protein
VSSSPSVAANPVTIEVTIYPIYYAAPEDVGTAMCPVKGFAALKGTQVKLEDGDGKLLNVGELGEIQNREGLGVPQDNGRKAVNCFATVTIPDAKASDFYRVTADFPVIDIGYTKTQNVLGKALTSPIVSKEKLKEEQKTILLSVSVE